MVALVANMLVDEVLADVDLSEKPVGMAFVG